MCHRFLFPNLKTKKTPHNSEPHLVVSVGKRCILGVHQHSARLLLHTIEGGRLHSDVWRLDVVREHLGCHCVLQNKVIKKAQTIFQQHGWDSLKTAKLDRSRHSSSTRAAAWCVKSDKVGWSKQEQTRRVDYCTLQNRWRWAPEQCWRWCRRTGWSRRCRWSLHHPRTDLHWLNHLERELRRGGEADRCLPTGSGWAPVQTCTERKHECESSGRHTHTHTHGFQHSSVFSTDLEFVCYFKRQKSNTRR